MLRGGTTFEIATGTAMPRIRRVFPPGIAQHVINRGNDRRTIFRKDGDYAAFLRLMADAQQRHPVDLLDYWVMSTHFHFVFWPQREDAIPAYMTWLMNAHVRQYHQHYETCGNGHIYQGRYKNFPIQTDHHLLTVLKYVGANPLRASLVSRAEHWKWSSLSTETWIARPEVSEGPVKKPSPWLPLVNANLDEKTLQRIRRSVRRGAPFGNDTWVTAFAEEHGLQFTLRNCGRPSKTGTLNISEDGTFCSDPVSKPEKF